MASSNEDIAQWPPGTVRIEDLENEQGSSIVLQPRPSCDPNDPLNWSIWRKHLNFALVSYYVIMVFALIDVATVTWGPTNAELGFSFAILNDSYAAGCGSLCIGGAILIPFALKYGRRPIYVVSTAAQCAISVWTARMVSVADLMLVNILSCVVGALAEVLVQMTIADIYFVHQRGLMNGIYVWFMNIGTSLSPLAGGYIVGSQGWRWVWWWMVILFGVGLVAFVFLYEETKFITPAAIEGIAVSRAPENAIHDGKKCSQAHVNTNTEQNVQKSDDAPKNPGLPITIDHSIPEKPYRQKLALWTTSPGSLSSFLRYSYEPFWMLFTIPAVIYMAVVYGAMTAAVTVTVTTLSSWMTMAPYNFSAAQIGLMGIPAFAGTSLAILIAGPLSDKLILVFARRNNGIYEPEMRLWVSLGFIPFVPAGLLMFGIGLNNGFPWPVPAIGLAISSFGATPPSSMALTYLTDAYTEIVAGALIGVTFIRNLISTIFVFALAPWIASSGLTGFYIAFSMIVTAILLVHILFIFHGKRMRAMTARRYRYFAGRQIDLRE